MSKHYSTEFKRHVLKDLANGMSVAATARKHGVSGLSVSNWKEIAEREAKQQAMTVSQDSAFVSTPIVADLQRKVEILNRENTVLRRYVSDQIVKTYQSAF